MSANASPVIRQRFFDSNGLPLNGGKLFSYSAGTVTPLATYTDQTAGTPNANPVILDSQGYCDVWLAPGSAYKFILEDSLNNVLWTKDNITQATFLDLNSNMSANGFIPGFTTTATAGATTLLTVASTQLQVFTGTTTQTVKMPVATTLVNGMYWVITNNSSGVVTIQSSGANTIQAMAASSQIIITCVNTAGGTGAAPWRWVYNPNPSGSVLPINLGGTNNGSLTVTAGGMFYSDGSKFINMGAGTTGQVPTSNGASAPTWQSVASFKFYASSQVTTDSTAVTSTSFVTFSNSPALSFTPTVSGTYKVYCVINCLINGSSGTCIASTKITNTTGSASLLQESQGSCGGSVGTTFPIGSAPAQSVYTLTALTAYVFDIQGKVLSTGNITASGSTVAPFYMFAELCG